MRRRALLAASQTGGGNEEVTFIITNELDGRTEEYTIPKMSWSDFVKSEYNPETPVGEKYFIIDDYNAVKYICIYSSDFHDTEYSTVLNLEYYTEYGDNIITNTKYIVL